MFLKNTPARLMAADMLTKSSTVDIYRAHFGVTEIMM